MTNLEKNPYRHGCYTGYNDRDTYRITAERDKHNKPLYWRAVGMDTNELIFADTLKELSQKLEARPCPKDSR